MTYKEKIHELIARIDTIYDDAGRLRDFATAQEKKHWNDLRSILFDAIKPLVRLDNNLNKHRAKKTI